MSLIQEIKGGNTLVFEDFFYQNHKTLFFYFLKKTKSYVDAEELTQLTFIKFWESKKSLKEEIDIQIQLYNRAKCIFIDWLRAQASRRRLMDDYYTEENSTNIKTEAPIFEFEDDDPRIKKMRDCITHFPAQRKKIFRLFHYEGYSYKQIAKILNISPKTVDNHIYQAIKELRKILSILLFLFYKIF